MADDEDAERTEGVAKPADRRPSDASEWTLSDARGPLGAAGSDVAATAEPAPYHPDAVSPIASDEGVGTNPAHEGPAPLAAGAAPGAAQRPQVPVLPIVAALIVGAVIGAGSAAVIYKSAGQGASQDEVAHLSSDVAALEKRPDPQPQLDELKASLDKVADAPKPEAYDPAPLQQKVASLQQAIDGLETSNGDQGLDGKVATLESDVAQLKGQGAEVAGLDQRLKSLAATVDGLKAQGGDVQGLATKVAALGTAVDGLKQQSATTQSGISALQSSQKTLQASADKPALAVVADSLVEAISRGRPYATQVRAAEALGADPAVLAVLSQNADRGVPSAQTLAAKFAPLSDQIVASAARAPADSGFVARLKSGMMSMVSIRRTDEPSGNDPGSRVSRIEADLAHGDVADAYSAWDGLPPAAKARSEAWGLLAKTHVEAMSAARALQQKTIASLGGKKS